MDLCKMQRHKPCSMIKIGNSAIGNDHPAYFVADIAANHDGSLKRAKELIRLCADAGANAAKFQNFKAETIVSDHGFRKLGAQLSHQANWEGGVYNVYDKASISLEWTLELKDTCKQAGIDYFTAPYDLGIIDYLDPHVAAWKVGSGDIDWLELIDNLAKRGKPLLIASGAAEMRDVEAAVATALEHTTRVVLMQCNTNYTGSLENFHHVNLNVLSAYKERYPQMILGLSDHTPGHATVLGAIALGARVIEKHFTDDCTREGPDHLFSMDPDSWRQMVERSRELQAALGDGIKRIEGNERDTRILQRRAVRASKELKEGNVLSKANLAVLRPCPENGFPPHMIESLIGKRVNRTISKGELLTREDLMDA